MQHFLRDVFSCRGLNSVNKPDRLFLIQTGFFPSNLGRLMSLVFVTFSLDEVFFPMEINLLKSILREREKKNNGVTYFALE